MVVYRIRADVTNYQGFYVTDEKVLKDRATSPTQLLGRPRLPTWTPPEVYIAYPLLIAGDFYDLNLSGQLILSPLCKDGWAIQRFLGDAGEMLPIFHEGREYKMLNVLECINCLDREKSEWKIYPKKLVFYPNRFAYSSIFKIPELLGANLTIDRDGDPENDFKAAYDHYGLTGLVFEPVWEG